MKRPSASLSILELLVLSASIAAPAYAEIHACRDGHGKLLYQEAPCSKAAGQTTVKTHPFQAERAPKAGSRPVDGIVINCAALDKDPSASPLHGAAADPTPKTPERLKQEQRARDICNSARLK